ncbi:MAG: hypothetical protein O3B09_01740, partial [Proteobacteria bacterium]|nr:hypothetical protein [Pseudomonadota bacterium]
ELRTMMNEARGYAIAVNNFYTQFDELPGDFGTAIDNSQVGDENGRIEFVNGAQAGATASTDTNEGMAAWHQLSAANIIDDTLVLTDNNPDHDAAAGAIAADTFACNVDVPSSKIKDGCWLFDYLTDATNGDQNMVIITNPNFDAASAVHTLGTAQALTSTELAGVITPSDALSVDSKMDDGDPDTGDVRDPITATNCVTSGVYDTSITTKACAISFDIDVLN